VTATAPGAAPDNGLRLGRVLGVPVLVAPSWFVFAGLLVLASAPALSEAVGQARAYTAAVSFALLLLASVLLHELGHAAVALAFGLPVRSITVTFLAGLTEITEQPQTPAREYAVAVVGPMVSLLLAGLGAAAVPLFAPDSLPWLLALGVAFTNGAVAAFNLLPGLPLDGGRVLRAGLWKLTGDAHLSLVAAAWSGRAVALVVVPAVPLLLLPALGFGDPTLVNVLFTALIGAFIYLGATASLQRARLLQRLPRARAGALARPALEVPSSLPLAEAVRRAHEADVHGLVVVDGAGRLEAVVSEAAVKATPEQRRPWVTVSAVARRLEDEMVLDPDLSGEDLLDVMRATPASEYVVRDPASGEMRVLVAADVAKAVSA
jgi:Zn-dependent protease/CBS domain-containing protein